MSKPKTRLPWFPYDIETWGFRMQDLTREEEGSLMALCREAWPNSPPCAVRDSERVFERVVGLAWKRVQPMLREHFTPMDGHPGMLRCEWLWELYQRQVLKHEGYVLRGGKGGRPRKDGTKPKPKVSEREPKVIESVTSEKPNVLKVEAGQETLGSKNVTSAKPQSRESSTENYRDLSRRKDLSTGAVRDAGVKDGQFSTQREAAAPRDDASAEGRDQPAVLAIARDTATATAPPGPLPSRAAALVGGLTEPVTRFLTQFWPKGRATKERREDVARQVAATLRGGAWLRKGALVKAYGVERLERACETVMANPPDIPDLAIVVLLKILNNTTDVSVARQEHEHVERQAEEQQTTSELAAAEAWLAGRPLLLAKIDAALDVQWFGANPENPIAVMGREFSRVSMVLEAWRAAGVPVDVEPYRPELPDRAPLLGDGGDADRFGHLTPAHGPTPGLPFADDPAALGAIGVLLETDEDRDALTMALARAPDVTMWLREMHGSLTGRVGAVALTPAQLGTALRAWCGIVRNNASPLTLEFFRSQLRMVARPFKIPTPKKRASTPATTVKVLEKGGKRRSLAASIH